LFNGTPMGLRQRKPWVSGPNGESVSLDDLPDASTNHWGLLRKARVVAAVEGGLIALNEACQRYNMSSDEYYMWRRQVIDRDYDDMRWID
jgi:hypothetical protein